MGFEFWRKIRKWAQGKESDAFLKVSGPNLQCPNCRVWWSAADGVGRLFSFGHPMAVAYHCGQCAHESAWVFEAGFWFRAQHFLGREVEIKQVDSPDRIPDTTKMVPTET